MLQTWFFLGFFSSYPALIFPLSQFCLSYCSYVRLYFLSQLVMQGNVDRTSQKQRGQRDDSIGFRRGITGM